MIALCRKAEGASIHERHSTKRHKITKKKEEDYITESVIRTRSGCAVHSYQKCQFCRSLTPPSCSYLMRRRFHTHYLTLGGVAEYGWGERH